MKSRMIQILSAAALLAGLVACSRPAANSAGGEAGGGGNTIVPLSTREEVEQAIDDAHKDLVYQFTQVSEVHFLIECDDTDGKQEHRGNQARQKPHLIEILRNFTKGCSFNNAGTFYAPKFEAIDAHTKIIKKPKGPCDTKGGAHRQAAVLDMADPNSPICMSVELLQGLPRDLMRAQIFGLEAHEYTHKAGYGEEDAILVQKFFISEIANKRLMTRNNLLDDVATVVKDIAAAQSLSPKAKEMCAHADKIDQDLKAFMAYYLFVRETSWFPRPGTSPEAEKFDDLAATFMLPQDFFQDVVCASLDVSNADVLDSFKTAQQQFDEMKSYMNNLIPLQY